MVAHPSRTIEAREWQLIALNTMFANLQRLHVFDRSTALITGAPESEERAVALRGWMDAVSRAFTSTLEGSPLGADAQSALLPLAPWLKDEVDAYYRQHRPDAPLREQAAFGAAHVFASDYQTKGERAIANAVGDESAADRLLQFAPRMADLVRQANATVGTSAQEEPDEQVSGFIIAHVRVAVGDEERMKLQVGAIPVMLQGRDPRGLDVSARGSAG